jgi:hypothetical protein
MQLALTWVLGYKWCVLGNAMNSKAVVPTIQHDGLCVSWWRQSRFFFVRVREGLQNVVPWKERVNAELWNRTGTDPDPREDRKNGSTVLTSSTKIEPRVELELNHVKTGPEVEGIFLTEPVPLVHTKKFFVGFTCGTLSVEFYKREYFLANTEPHKEKGDQEQGQSEPNHIDHPSWHVSLHATVLQYMK